ncbi:MAG: PDZ domain-containing protein [Planctomycetota bacterium]
MRIAGLLLVLSIVPVHADEELDAALVRLRRASTADAPAEIAAIVGRAPDRAVLLDRLESALVVPADKAGWHVAEARDENGVVRPFEYYVPASLVGKRTPVPLVVHLHGGVSRPAWFPQPGRRSTGSQWVPSADEHGFLLAFPYGRQDCVWWSAAGAANVRAVIREMKRRAPVDDRRVIGTGFSDGASGCYYLAMAEPEPFAAFLPLNGHFAVAASASNENLYLANLRDQSLFIAQTSDDQLYPVASMMPHIDAALAAGVRLTFVNYPRGGHRPVYFDEQRAAMVRFVLQTPREARPARFAWRTATARLGVRYGVEILDIGAREGDPAAAADHQVMSTPGRVRLGVQVDRNYAGPGVRIDEVVAGSVAAAAGLQKGDVLVRVGRTDTVDMGGLRTALGALTYGDESEFAVRRGDAEVVCTGKFPEFRARPVYRREGVTAELRYEAEGNDVQLHCRSVGKLRILLPNGDTPSLQVNGKPVQPAVETLDVKRILQDYARHADRGRIWDRVVTVIVP